MKPSRESLRALAARPPEQVAIWLARGFLDTVRGAGGDPFAPHSFVHLSAHLAEGIEDLYEVARPELQKALRTGIVMLGSYCRYNCPESAMLDEEQRLRLLSQFLRLSSNLVCIPAAPVIAQIACEDVKYWTEKHFKLEIFPSCCVCLQDLGLRFDESAFAPMERKLRKDVKAALYLIAARHEPRFAPRTLAALINVSPEHLLDHLELLGDLVTTMHQQDKAQEALAYLTAQRIVNKALGALHAGFEKLQIGAPTARDAWLLSALLSPDGPLLHRRLSPTRIVVAPRENPRSKLHFKNKGLATARLPLDTLHRPTRKGKPSWLQRFDRNYLDKPRKIDLTLPRNRTS